MKFLFISLLFIVQSYATELSISNFYRLNRTNNSDLAAEVCFTLNPKPTTPTFVQVTADPGTNFRGYYNTWIDNRGTACLIISTTVGKVLVEIPKEKISISKQI